MVEDTLPPMDDMSNTGPTEQELLDAVMAQSPIMDEIEAPPLPDEEEIVEDSEESVDEDPETEEAVSEEEEEVEETEEEPEGEDAPEGATQDTDVFSADDLDLDAKIAVKVDGEELEVSFGDLLKGYQTDAHLSKKGRELGEAQKSVEAEHAERLSELDKMAGMSQAVLQGAEQAKAKEYHDIEAQIKKARDDGDTYELGDLKDKREQVQQEYWNARRGREGMLAQYNKHKEEFQQKQFGEQIEYFQQEIPNLIPGFDEKTAGDIREFALSEGIAEGLLDTIVDPVIVKFIDDYRRLKNGVSKGKAKRKAAPAKKALPIKKAPPTSKKKADAEKMVKARAFKEGSSQDDQMAFLRGYASKSLKL